MASSIVNNVIYGTIGLTVLFLLSAMLILPQFSAAWRYCHSKTWEGANSSIAVAGRYANCSAPYYLANTTPVAPATGTHTERGETNAVDTDNSADVDNFCLNCSTPGGYRTTVQGLTLLVLVLALIGFGIGYIRRR